MTLEDIRTTAFDEAQPITKTVKEAQVQALGDMGHAIAIAVRRRRPGRFARLKSGVWDENLQPALADSAG